MNPSDLIKQRRLELGLTLEEVGNRVGVSKVAVKKWEDGAVNRLKTENIIKLAEVLKLNPVDLLGDVFQEPKQNNIIPLQDFTTIPILGSIPCGNPKDREPEKIGDLMIEKNDIRGGDYFALYADGDSMSPTINDGETVVVRKQPTAENGELVAACVDGAITLKRFKVMGNTPILMPDNPAYEPITINDSECTYIIGKVTQSIQIKRY